jgi:hypothetical protein
MSIVNVYPRQQIRLGTRYHKGRANLGLYGVMLRIPQPVAFLLGEFSRVSDM